MRCFVFLIGILGFFYISYSIFAQDLTSDCQTNAECQQKSNEINQKLIELGKAKNTLANQIKIIDSQIQLTLLKISQTQTSIKTLISEIANLSTEIGKLDVNLNELSSVYIQQVNQNYRLAKKASPISIFLSSDSFNSFLEQYKYISLIQKNSQDTLVNMETIRTNYDIQYQELLIAVQNKLASFNNSNAGCLSSPANGGSDDNYYSQIDPRWCKNFIGLQTKYTIGGAGCYLTSMSIILTKLGFRITPAAYASDPGRFSSTADLVDPSVPSGFTYQKITGYNQNAIDSELKNGRYVIAQIPMPSSVSGSHFVVLISGSNGNYKMHDPWRGADLDFNTYYSTSRIISLRLITK
ncbi:MAG: hypothetical protein NTY75_03840 [Candidatus Shapirobacteria bacterium]|nr:hypothetical protein [Candidatus Shapirobacteria bacterium]